MLDLKSSRPARSSTASPRPDAGSAAAPPPGSAAQLAPPAAAADGDGDGAAAAIAPTVGDGVGVDGLNIFGLPARPSARAIAVIEPDEDDLGGVEYIGTSASRRAAHGQC